MSNTFVAIDRRRAFSGRKTLLIPANEGGRSRSLITWSLQSAAIGRRVCMHACVLVESQFSLHVIRLYNQSIIERFLVTMNSPCENLTWRDFSSPVHIRKLYPSKGRKFNRADMYRASFSLSCFPLKQRAIPICLSRNSDVSRFHRYRLRFCDSPTLLGLFSDSRCWY